PILRPPRCALRNTNSGSAKLGRSSFMSRKLDGTRRCRRGRTQPPRRASGGKRKCRPLRPTLRETKKRRRLGSKEKPRPWRGKSFAGCWLRLRWHDETLEIAPRLGVVVAAHGLQRGDFRRDDGSPSHPVFAAIGVH